MKEKYYSLESAKTPYKNKQFVEVIASRDFGLLKLETESGEEIVFPLYEAKKLAEWILNEA